MWPWLENSSANYDKMSQKMSKWDEFMTCCGNLSLAHPRERREERNNMCNIQNSGRDEQRGYCGITYLQITHPAMLTSQEVALPSLYQAVVLKIFNRLLYGISTICWQTGKSLQYGLKKCWKCTPIINTVYNINSANNVFEFWQISI